MSDESPDHAPTSRQREEIAGKLQGRHTVTLTISVVCVALFLLRYVWSDAGETEHLLRMGANHGPRVRAGEVWRLLASAFLHGDIVHLIANTIALWSFGTVLEALLGPRRYLVLYGASALAGSIASAFFTAPRLSVGASGAVWGLMTAGIALVYRPQGLLPPGMLASARARAWTPLALNVMISLRPGVDFLAHIGGGVVGAGLFLSGAITSGLAPLHAAPVSRRDARGEKPLWRVLAALTAIAMIGSVAAGLVAGKPWEAGKPPVLVHAVVSGAGITVDLPESVASEVKIEVEDGATTALYGNNEEDSLLFEVFVSPLDAALPAESLEPELAEMAKTMQGMPDGATRVVAPRIETLGGHRVIVDEVKLKSDVPMKRYALFVGARLVMIRSYEVGDRPKSWAGIEAKVVESVAAK